MSRICHAVAVACWLSLFAMYRAPAVGQDANTSPPAANVSIEEEIRSQLRRYVQAFNARDFETLAGMIGEPFRYHDQASGDPIEDARTFLDRVKRSVDAEPSLKLIAQANAIRLENESQAIVQGETTLMADDVPDEHSAFTVTMAKQATGWKIQDITEQPEASTWQASASNAIASLGWLLGTWEDSSPQKIRSQFRFLPGQKFLRRTLMDPSSDQSLGFEIIGYDPQSNLVRSWVYFTDGSFGSGTWTGGDNHWSCKLTQTLSDGRTALGTYIIRPQDENTMVVQLISREIDGEPLPRGEAITMTRVDSEPANLSASENQAGDE